jgi:hypothetical protein
LLLKPIPFINSFLYSHSYIVYSFYFLPFSSFIIGFIIVFVSFNGFNLFSFYLRFFVSIVDWFILGYYLPLSLIIWILFIFFLDYFSSEICEKSLWEILIFGNSFPRTALELMILLQKHFFVFFLDKTTWFLYTLLDNWIVDESWRDFNIVREIEPESIAFASKYDVNRTFT